MAAIGYTLSCEEHEPSALVEHARRAEEAIAESVVCAHQVGPDQEGFFEFYERDVLPGLL